MKELIRRVINRAGFDIVRYPDPVAPKINVVDLVLEHVASLRRDFFFIQIGANDGLSADPIHAYVRKYHWRGILVEPHPVTFQKLVDNYAGEKQLIFENAAIAHEDGFVSLFTVEDSAQASWSNGSASLRKSHVTRIFGKNTPINEIQVPALSVSSLLLKHAVSKIDLLQIDAEGFDYEIIKMFNFKNIKPTVINLEHCHMSGPERRECWRYLADWGYSLMTGGWDTLAFLERP
jgi:FkbM family methyltransferase